MKDWPAYLLIAVALGTIIAVNVYYWPRRWRMTPEERRREDEEVRNDLQQW